MSVYVDELRRYPNAPHPFRAGACHLTADSMAELHEFAERIGLRREWFQEDSVEPHYDLTPRRRRRALKEGAVFVPALQQARERRTRRRAIDAVDGFARCLK